MSKIIAVQAAIKSCRNRLVSIPLMVSLVVSFLLLCSPVSAQNSSGSIVGTVTDPTGAVVPGASVTVTNLSTNEKRTARSGANGEYRFLDLLPSNYKIEVSAKTFKEFEVASGTVQVDSTLRVDAPMQVGASDETVIVTTRPPLLQTESGTLGYEVEGKQVEEMPLNGRNIQNLIALVPGVVPQGGSEGAAGVNQVSHTSNGGWGAFQIGGGFANQSAEYIDGGPVNSLGGNAIALVIAQDSVQEFRVATNAVSPEFGRFSGGVVEIATKSGASAFHGTVYEYFRNNVLNSNNFFNKLAGLKRAPWNVDQYGAALSGPLKKDKAFFFGAWEGYKSLLGVPNPTNVPTADLQAGYFTRQVVDPTGKCPIVKTTTGPYPGEWQIPQSCWDSTAAVLKNLFPLPITPNNPAANWYVAPKTGTNTNQYTGRVDSNLSAQQRLFARYTFWTLQDQPASEFNNFGGFMSGNAFSKTAAHQAIVGDTYTVNPNTIVDLRVSYLRNFYNQVAPSLGSNESQFGPAYAALAPAMTFHTIPEPALTGTHGLYAFNATDFASVDKWNMYSIVGDVIRNAGHHTFKFGGEARRSEHSGLGNIQNSSGRFAFSNATTAVGGNASNGTGDEFASFLLGQFQTGTITTAQAVNTFNYSGGVYGQDTWQITRSLTLNLGVRWELPGGFEENHDRATVLLPHTLDPNTGFVGTLALVNGPLYASRSLEPFHYGLFSPRVGFAKRFGANSVLRGGYGLIYASPDLPGGVMAYASTVNNAGTTTQNGPVPTIFLSNPFPTGILEPLGRSNPAFMTTRLGQALTGPVPTTNFPYNGQWNLTWAQELGTNLLMQFGYVGAKGTHLPIPGSYGIDELGSQNYTAAGTTPGGVSLTSTAPCAQDNNLVVSVGQCLRPYPEYKNLSNSAAYVGSSSYNSLQSQAQLRLHSGGVITGNYTWAKLITNTDGIGGAEQAATSGTVGAYQDYNNPRGERSLASFDVHHRAVISYVVDLPFGKGRKYGANVTGLTDKLVSGWAVNGITTFQSGFPLELTYNGGNNLTTLFGAGTLRPNYTVGCQKQTTGSRFQRGLTTGWFNTSCFTSPGNYGYGNQPRTDASVRSQGIDNFDFSVLKSTQIRDAVNAQLRMEFFNIFNHTQFAEPGLALNGAGFGIVTTTVNQPRIIQASLRFKF